MVSSVLIPTHLPVAVQLFIRGNRNEARRRIYYKYLFAECAMKTAKVFKHGNSQAVRLPKEFRFDDDEVLIKRSAGGVLLLPKKIAYERVMASLLPAK